ncbi:MAG TPA: EscU/YscU/HrcU family type III secretion system export apparatus switch protein [Candidatus Elarobacter sp.]|jgi:flagellar biosynthesis protein|nr:EscU/YscU/HrcU family type III secretion system export apparatus switch protein [Candidatus Elarobacter sp.]
MNARYYDTRRNAPQRPAAAALSYDPIGPEPPEIVAIGRGLTAEEIVRIARENDVPIHQDAGLVEALAKLEVGRSLPRELYAVVAEVLAFVYAVDAQAAS